MISVCLEIFDSINDNIEINPLKGHAWKSMDEDLDEVTTPLIQTSNYINSQSLKGEINTFIKKHPLDN